MKIFDIINATDSLIQYTYYDSLPLLTYPWYFNPIKGLFEATTILHDEVHASV